MVKINAAKTKGDDAIDKIYGELTSGNKKIKLVHIKWAKEIMNTFNSIPGETGVNILIKIFEKSGKYNAEITLYENAYKSQPMYLFNIEKYKTKKEFLKAIKVKISSLMTMS